MMLWLAQNAKCGYVDLGAAYISQSQQRLQTLLSKYMLNSVVINSNGDTLTYRNVRRYFYVLITCSA